MSQKIPFKTAAQVSAQRDTIARNRQQQSELANIYAEYPWLVKSTATDKLLVDIVSRFLGVQPGEVLITLLDFKQAYWANQGAINEMFGYGLNVPVEKQRVDIIKAIAELLAPESFHAEKFRLSGMNLDALRARLTEIKLKQALNKFPAAAVRQAAKEIRGTEGGTPLPAEWTRERLLAASSHCIKFLNAKFGVSAVNARLANRG